MWDINHFNEKKYLERRNDSSTRNIENPIRFSKILQECISCRRKVFPTGINSSQVVILYEIKIFIGF